MKNWPFITILVVVVDWFVYLWLRIDALQKYSTNIDNNVAKIDERLVWDVVPQVEQIESSTLEIKSSIDYMLDSFQN